MEAARGWDEEVMKWLAVAICLAMVGMAVMPAFQPLNLAFELYYGHHESLPITAASAAYEGIVITATLAAAAATAELVHLLLQQFL
ncbi:hypothetical protein [Archaeoglobus fulgidus]|uniref:Uncharacterized protein AF_0148 n=1 Tax=Archaeoglobus fulgidus (strain ATCC 49558 / DSM 4304 / JCM 9628 / NBRC 100126 / VC-16) TaxID=224325 RepID=Y148_ARCFU|nr:hypothetical protein [Archaeoglobus fulgidus]O30089.1 RecName: Full=Uncharacterized protein AF_0148 [Archaeoglobus fulgidus DSM 4304]AAB91089.1 predicted coding region AF_0148 [Archaeoglobus fulgidus DSM 4304]